MKFLAAAFAMSVALGFAPLSAQVSASGTLPDVKLAQAAGQEISVSGRQLRGSGPISNAQLDCGRFSVPRGRTAVITRVSVTPAGFWIMRDGNMLDSFRGEEAIGLELDAGDYRFCPAIPQGRYEGLVTVTVAFR